MKRSTLILSILLVASLSVNLAVAGVMIGHRMRGGGPPGGMPDKLLGLVPDRLLPDIHQAMHPRDPAVRQQMDALRDARRNAVVSLRNRPFNREAAEAAFAALRTETARAQERLHQTIIDRMAAAQAAGTLPPPPDRGDRRGGNDDRPPMDGPPPDAAPPPPPPPPPER